MAEERGTALIAEDEAPLRRFMRAALGAQGWRVIEAGTLREAMAMLTTHHPDVLLLDLGMPDGDGLDLVRELRGWSGVPVLVISARGREDDKVVALDAGADDYLTKPFGVNELLARMRAICRRAEGTAAQTPVLRTGTLEIDQVARLVRRDGIELHLTPIEYKLLVLLARHRGRVLTHDQILREVWGPAYAGHAHYVRVHMAELRRKVEVEASRPQLLLTEPGVGYRMRDSEG
jgi:two-component system KDP operon response regulator KdpE